jgi:HEPN domain-containing protein
VYTVRRWKDWLEQAKFNLEHAHLSLDAGHLDWACFAAQQAAEMAVKALYRSWGDEPIGHSIYLLLQKLPRDHRPENEILDEAKVLDRVYIPSRYPNGLPEGTPRHAFNRRDAEEAIQIAERVVRFCDSQTAGSP